MDMEQWLAAVDEKRHTTAVYVGSGELEQHLFERYFAYPQTVCTNAEVAKFVALLHNESRWQQYRARARFINYNVRHSPHAEQWARPENYRWLVHDATARDLWPERYANLSSETEVLSIDQVRSTVPESDLYRCNACGSRRVLFSQMQTRSADEPMTSFFRCVECNKNWKK